MGDLVLTWDSVSGWPTVGDFIIRLDHPNNGTTEYVLCTSVNVGANQTTVTRAQENTSASGGFIVGSTGANAFTKKMYDDSVVRLDTSLSQTLTGPLAIPTALGAAPAATSYGTVPLKFAETLLGSAAASVSFTSIPSTFRHLKSDVYTRSDLAANATTLSLVRLNNDTTANYDEYQHYDNGATTVSGSEGLGVAAIDLGPMPAATATANFFGQAEVSIKHYAGTTGNKLVHVIGGSSATNTTLNQHHRTILAKWRTVATAVNRLDYLHTGGNHVAGSFFSVQLEP